MEDGLYLCGRNNRGQCAQPSSGTRGEKDPPAAEDVLHLGCDNHGIFSKGKYGYPWESTLAVCSLNIQPYALYNPYIVGTWWYKSRVLPQGYPPFPFDFRTCEIIFPTTFLLVGFDGKYLVYNIFTHFGLKHQVSLRLESSKSIWSAMFPILVHSVYGVMYGSIILWISSTCATNYTQIPFWIILILVIC